jgi:hypothetical protein
LRPSCKISRHSQTTSGGHRRARRLRVPCKHQRPSRVSQLPLRGAAVSNQG